MSELRKIIKLSQSNSVPLPLDYCTDLEDNSEWNHAAYVSFHNRIGRLMADECLNPVDKLVMVAYFVYGLSADDMTICVTVGIDSARLREARHQLMLTDWLASPEG